MNHMNIDSSFYVVLGFAGLIQCVVLYLVINFATKADKRTKYEWAQMNLLGKIALRQGYQLKKSIKPIKLPV